jgi:hypothetical protein
MIQGPSWILGLMTDQVRWEGRVEEGVGLGQGCQGGICLLRKILQDVVKACGS